MTKEQNTEKKEDLKDKKAADKPAAKPAPAPKSKGGDKKIAVIRLRGRIRVKEKEKSTLDMLKLFRNNYCVVIKNTASYIGMLKKVSHYITWGEIDESTYKLLIEKRGKKVDGKLKPFFRLSPPKGGFERKGTKKPFTIGGALGDRKEKINDLIKKMI